MEEEKRRRINICIWAWAYEKYAVSLVSDSKWDTVALLIDLKKTTDHLKLDRWFKKNFVPYTAQWIYKHPELTKLTMLTQHVIEVSNGFTLV